MRIFFFIFALFITNYINVKGANSNHGEGELNGDFLLLHKANITAVVFSGNKKEEKIVLSEIFPNEGTHNRDPKSEGYILLDEQIDSYEMLSIQCTFKVQKKFDKTKLVILLVKQLEKECVDREGKKYTCQSTVQDLKEDETFIFTNELEENLVISKVSFLFVNLIPFDGYYTFDLFLTDGSNFVKIHFFKLYLHFLNHLPIVLYPLYEKENAVVRSVMRKELHRRDQMYTHKHVVQNHKDYYSLPIIRKRSIMYGETKQKRVNSIIPMVLVTLLFLLFLIHIYFTFLHLKYNMKNMNISYFNYAFLFSFVCVMILFILYDLFFNLLQMLYIFPFVFSLFLVFFYKALNALREYRKGAS
ncbi:conserved Plasmodium protein, unknown function [Plasmodium knowlesi strain H]|uniref:Dolichyl-diphosphooligosaccharide--protein glycosyltransferase subunit 2 n=3 Tax=Plasmodium knowlesi TaxID=5850 RepID=A0A5K1U8B4_PLAKH|nr:conserved Plasmodium protein, unknown function [Plasmodium knowlesi strain H]OTN66914.1 Uncharacterized protein PKNOH_S07444600 [Plasmodium knowlesi]CAA9988573.1 conserved Plasmodium protein, unknown function [Plasmodium knowlesi strain H]SBO21378.1 conserved Plasmodium protein, unknown function [Plasmodium knowlesi strain H]SBO21834.1 conserved Plasmodium protein, unknown function [Plasmodium knowlesi strain H]VVS78047.1 conserved Plasmodium protein, unknown function [Plasmodium knowlesi s|eukprot:XP_002259549.1 hypothetical protein, conserved in Plasmodium species [Plasmodium knowlesi strain H]